MKISETKLFSKLVYKYINDLEFLRIVSQLLENPKKGDIVKGAGGLRKLRWGLDSKGKSGGLRIIYYHESEKLLLFVFIYSKSETAELTKEQYMVLKQIIEED